MIYIKGEYVGSNSYKRGEYTVNEIGIREEGKLSPRIVQVPSNFVNKYKIGDTVELPLYVCSYDSVVKKYTVRGVKLSVLAEPKQ